MTRKITAAHTLARLAAAAAMVLAASSSHAGATLNIVGFSVSTDGIPVLAPKFAWASNATSDLTVSAQNGGGLYGSENNAYTANAWEDSNNVTATTSAASAFGNAVTFTDTPTQLITGGFNLISSAQRANFGQIAQPSVGTATGLQTGGFTLLDGNGEATSGTITFDIYYQISITGPAPGSVVDYSMATLNFSANDADGNQSYTNFLNSASLTNGTGAISDGHFTVTFALLAGEVASYSLSGTAVSSAMAVPEPGTLAFSALGLALIGVAVRRSRQRAEA